MNKRIVSLLFAVTLLITMLFSGCGQKAPVSDVPADTGTQQPAETTPADTTTSPEDTTPAPEDSAGTVQPEDGAAPTADGAVLKPSDQTSEPVPAEITAPEKVTAPEKPTAPAKTTKPPKTAAPAKATTPAKTTTPAKPTAPETTTPPAETAKPEETAPTEATPPAEEKPSDTATHEIPWATDNAMVTVDKDKVHSIETDEGLFTVRYMLLDSGHKSGDSILIHTPSGKFILIDAGRPECGSIVVEKLKQLGVTKLDALINTHPHVDHLGGIPTIVNSFPVDIYYRNPREYDTSYFRDAIAAVKKNNIPIQILYEGDEIDFGDDITVHLYNPPKEQKVEELYPSYSEAGQTNQESLVMMFSYKDVKFLFVGDMYKLGESDMLARYPEGTFDSDFIHAGHHGANTSSSPGYLLATDPIIVMMSTNGLQSYDVYQQYALYGAVTLANSVNGDVLVTSDGTKEGFHAYVEYQLDPGTVQPVAE